MNHSFNTREGGCGKYHVLFGIIVGSLFFYTASHATPPSPDVTVKVEKVTVTAKDKEGLSVRLDLKLHALLGKGLKSLALDVRMFDYKDGTERGERSLLRQDFSAPIPAAIPLDVRIARSATYVVEAKVMGGEPGLGFSHVNRVYLLSNGRGEASLIEPADFKHRENLANGSKVKRLFGSTPQAHSADGWPLTVRMLVQYLDSSGATMPLPYATVEIWEDDLVFDDYLGSFVLDITGRAHPTVAVPTDPLGTDEIYLVVKTQNGDRFTLGTASQASSSVTVYKYQNSDTSVYQGNDANVVFTIPNAARELGLWSIFNPIRDYITGQFNYSPKAFNIWFPSSGADEAYFSRSYNLIAIGDNYAQSNMVIAHEYGHDLMWQLNDEWMPEAGGSHSVCPGTAIDNKLAWVEGYATAFALSATNSRDGVFHWTPGDAGLDIEHYSCSYTDLDTDEMRIAAAIWDLVDTNNDCNQGSTYQGRNGFCDENQPFPISVKNAYYDAVKGQQQETVFPYWWFLHDNFMSTPQQPLAENIMKYDWAAYTNSAINSFYAQCVDTPQRCESGAYDFMYYWDATAHSCQVSYQRNNGTWYPVSNSCSGSSGGVASWSSQYAIKLQCRGWGTAEQTIYEPAIGYKAQ